MEDIHGSPFKPTVVGLSDKAPLIYRLQVEFLEDKLNIPLVAAYGCTLINKRLHKKAAPQ